MWKAIINRLAPSDGAASHTFRHSNLPDDANLVVEPREILRTFSELIASGEVVSLLHRDGDCPVRSRIVHVDMKNKRLLLRRPEYGSSPITSHQSHAINLTARYKRASIVSSLHDVQSSHWNGVACYSTAMPDWILSLELRDCIRITPLKSDHVGAIVTMLGEPPLICQVINMSENGMRLRVKSGAVHLLRKGLTFESVTVSLPDGVLNGLTGRVRHIDTTSSTIEFGLQFTHFPNTTAQHMRRYVQSRSTWIRSAV